MDLTEMVMVRLTTQDKEKLTEQAKKKRLPLSTYIRYAVLGE